MAEYSNAQILSAVLAEWARPAITQIASSKLVNFPAMQGLQSVIIGSGLVPQTYSIASEIEPFIQPVITTLVAPMIEQWVSNVPDVALPTAARAAVDEMKTHGSFSILNGLVTFDADDINELSEMLEKNLPVECSAGYQVVR